MSNDDTNAPVSVPAVLLNKMPTPDTLGAEGCWLGGLPTLPTEIEWPWYIVQDQPIVPMHFMAQINLSKLPRPDGFLDLPAAGTLFVFHTPVMPAVLGGHDAGCRVYYVEETVSQCPAREMPAFPALSTFPVPGEEWEFNYKDTRMGPLDRWNFDFLVFETYDVDSGPILEMWDDIWYDMAASQYDRIASSTKQYEGGVVLHHMYGANATGYGPFHKDNVNLLAIGTDADLGFGDVYRVQWTQFCMKRKDLENRDWSNVWIEGGGS